MTTANIVDNIVVQAINNTEPPADKAKSLVQVLTLSAGVPIEQDFSLLINRQEIHGGIRAIYIDNSAGTSGCSISTLAMGTVIVPAGYQGVIPLFMSGDNTIYFTGAGTVKYAVSNTDTTFALWPTGRGSSIAVGGPIYAQDLATGNFDPVSINPSTFGVTFTQANSPYSLMTTCQLVAQSGANMVPIQGGEGLVDGFGQGYSLDVASINHLFNGTTWDRARNNVDTTALITLAAQGVGTVNSADQTNYNGRGVNLVIDLTAVAAGSLTVTIQGKDIASGKYYTILSSAALTAVATTLLSAYPGNAAVANASIALPLPRTWRVSATNTAGTVTGTIGASVIV